MRKQGLFCSKPGNGIRAHGLGSGKILQAKARYGRQKGQKGPGLARLDAVQHGNAKQMVVAPQGQQQPALPRQQLRLFGRAAGGKIQGVP